MLSAAWMSSQRGGRGVEMCLAARHCAQSLWRQGKTAQAILQLNRVLASRDCWEGAAGKGNPYRALRWMVARPLDGVFMGNPVRHFQHLATRVRGPDAGLRSWRAWACFHLCRIDLAAEEFPPDREQAAREGLRYPSLEEIEAGLAGENGAIEVAAFREALEPGA